MLEVQDSPQKGIQDSATISYEGYVYTDILRSLV
jgi:hypothetical protein